MKKYFILTNYSEYYSDKMTLLSAASKSGAYSYVNRTIDKIVRESVEEGWRIQSLERDEYESSIVIDDLPDIVMKRYAFKVFSVDMERDLDKWFIFESDREGLEDSISVSLSNDYLSACKGLCNAVDCAVEIHESKPHIDWSNHSASVGTNCKFVMMSVREMLEMK